MLDKSAARLEKYVKMAPATRGEPIKGYKQQTLNTTKSQLKAVIHRVASWTEMSSSQLFSREALRARSTRGEEYRAPLCCESRLPAKV